MRYFTEDRRVSREGIIGTILFHLILLLCFLYFWGMQAGEPPEIKGMMINFGTVAESTGDEMPSSPSDAVPPDSEEVMDQVDDALAQNQPSPEAPEALVENEIVTDASSEAPAIPVKNDKKEKEKEKERLKKEAEAAAARDMAEREKKEREIDPETLFGGNQTNNSDQQTSQGNSNSDPMGDQGVDDARVSSNSQTSDLYDPSRDIGMGPTGAAQHSLEGRSVSSRAEIKDETQKVGKIRVKIKVDQNGNVIGADYVAKNSTTTDAGLRRKAIAAAKKWRFNIDKNKPPVQVGYIDFTFKVN